MSFPYSPRPDRVPLIRPPAVPAHPNLQAVLTRAQALVSSLELLAGSEVLSLGVDALVVIDVVLLRMIDGLVGIFSVVKEEETHEAEESRLAC